MMSTRDFALLVSVLLFSLGRVYAQSVPILEPRLTLESEQPDGVDDVFGIVLDVSSSTIVVSDVGATDGVKIGSVYAYDANSGDLRFPLEPQVDDGESVTSFGVGLAVYDDLVVAGGVSGGAFVFDAATGAQVQRLRAPMENVNFGIDVDVNENYVAVGDAAGNVQVYDRKDWSELHYIPRGQAGSDRRVDLALHGDLLLTGIPQNRRGAAFLYDLTTGEHILEIRADDVEWFGDGVALDQERIFISSIGNNSGVFSYDHSGKLLREAPISNVSRAISLHGEFLAVRDANRASVLDAGTLQVVAATDTFPYEGVFDLGIYDDQLVVGPDSRKLPRAQVFAYDVPEPTSLTILLTVCGALSLCRVRNSRSNTPR